MIAASTAGLTWARLPSICVGPPVEATGVRIRSSTEDT